MLAKIVNRGSVNRVGCDVIQLIQFISSFDQRNLARTHLHYPNSRPLIRSRCRVHCFELKWRRIVGEQRKIEGKFIDKLLSWRASALTHCWMLWGCLPRVRRVRPSPWPRIRQPIRSSRFFMENFLLLCKKSWWRIFRLDFCCWLDSRMELAEFSKKVFPMHRGNWNSHSKSSQFKTTSQSLTFFSFIILNLVALCTLFVNAISIDHPWVNLRTLEVDVRIAAHRLFEGCVHIRIILHEETCEREQWKCRRVIGRNAWIHLRSVAEVVGACNSTLEVSCGGDDGASNCAMAVCSRTLEQQVHNLKIVCIFVPGKFFLVARIELTTS